VLWIYVVPCALISVLVGAGVEEFDGVLGDQLRDEQDPKAEPLWAQGRGAVRDELSGSEHGMGSTIHPGKR
jgi:hypothetical protein